MRLALASLIAAVGVAPLAFAQTPPPPEPGQYPPPAQPGQYPPAAAPAAQPSPTTPAPPTSQAPATVATPAPQEAAPPAPPPPPAAQEAAPPAPPPPPAAPTDPTTMDLINTLESVCIPAVEGGNFDRLSKADGFRKNGDNNYVLKGRGFQLTLVAPGSNPNQCHVDIVSPVYAEAPAAAIVIALHNWAAVSRGWTLYRNDKNVEGSEQLTTRSWEHDDPGKHEAMFITTYRHADGSPMKGSSDTSTMVYSETPTSG